MKLSFKIIYVAVILAAFSTDTMFRELGVKTYHMVIALSVPLSFIFLRQHTPYMRNWLFAFSLYFFVCMLESYYYYNTPLKHSHVFAKIMLFYIVFFVYGFYKRFDRIHVTHVVIVYLIGFVLNAIFVNSEAFSLSAFLRNHRGLASESVYGMVLVVVFFFNKYFSTRNVLYFFGFLASFGVVLFLQHRTVWLCAGLALTINFLMLGRSKAVKIDGVALIPVTIILMLIFMSFGVVILSNEKITDKIGQSIEDIMNPTGKANDDEFSTAEWRYMQFQAYWPFIEDNFILGMRLKGYELPIQFYDPTGKQVWEDNTGHHFHSFYIDRLFYQGMLGIFLTVIPAFFYIFTCVFRNRNLTLEQLTLFSFVSTALLYGISWMWPAYFFGILGYAIFKLEQTSTPEKNKLKDDKEEKTSSEMAEVLA